MKKRIGLGRAKLEADSQRLMDIISGTVQHKNLIIFHIGKEYWALPLEQVIQVLRASKYTIYKDISDVDLIRGYIFIRQKAIPIISIHKFLGLDTIEDIDIWTSILICKAGNLRFGLLSENVLEVSPILRENSLGKIPIKLLDKHKKIITGTLAWRDKPVIILDLQEFFAPEDIDLLIEESNKVESEYKEEDV